jgi:outer membrane lipoprotein
MYKGKFVLWGGEIIKILPQDGETYIEVFQKPLGWRGRPGKYSASQGKFIVIEKEFLDLSLFKKGKKITVAGEIQGEIFGEKIKFVSEKDYRYPFILSRQIHLWKEYFSPYSSLPPPRSPHDPYWYDPSERPLRF